MLDSDSDEDLAPRSKNPKNGGGTKGRVRGGGGGDLERARDAEVGLEEGRAGEGGATKRGGRQADALARALPALLD